MSRPSGKTALALSGFILLAAAMCIRCFTISGVLPSRLSVLRNVIHLALLTAWGISIHVRIIQTQVRRYLLAAAGLMGLWLLLKMISYSIDLVDANRYLWYFYYIPMLFIPIISLFISMSLGRAEDYCLPQRTALLYLPTTSLLILVLTNDLHQCVFSFPSGVMTPRAYRHEAGYYIVLGWIMLCALAAFAAMLKKCRIARSRKVLVLPLLPLALSLAYTVAYIRGVRAVLLLAGDMTVVQCLLIAAAFEGCIQCGLIQSNMGYKELFEATTLPVQITDADFSPQNTSDAMPEPLSRDVLRQMTSDTVRRDGDTLLKRYRLRDGWVLWEEDISEIRRLHEALELTQEELRGTGNVLAAENAQREKLLRLSEENRLYDLMETETAGQIETLRSLLAKIKQAEDADTARRLFGQVIVIGTYVKRRNNLIFVGAQRGTISAQELRLCFNESIESLSLCGVTCRALVNGEGPLSSQQAAQIYDLFEAVAEAGAEALESLLVSVQIDESIEVNICALCRKPLCTLRERFRDLEWTEDEDGLQYIVQRLEGRGDMAHGQD